jgi:glycosyltransferase involved in cell wall biosynthesis
MTTGMSLRRWEESGFLDRELSIYKEIANRLNMRVVFISYGGEDEVDYLQGEDCFGVIPKVSPGMKDLRYSLKVGKKLGPLWQRFSLIKSNQMRGAWAGLHAKKKFGVPFVVRCGYEWVMYEEHLGRRGGLYMWMARRMERKVYDQADAILMPGQDARIFIQERYGVPDEKVHVFMNSINMGLFKPSEGLGPIPGRIITVSRLEDVKRLDVLIRAIAHLPGDHNELVVVGEGSKRAVLEAQAQELGVKTHFYGRVPNTILPEMLIQSEAFVLSSGTEGNPKALMEAMGAGRPCVATDVPGSRDLIQHGENGLLSALDAESIAANIRRFQEEEGLAERCGAAAAEFARTHFDIHANLDREVTLLKSLIASP